MQEIRFNIRQFIGIAIDRLTINTNNIGAGSTYWATDTGTGYIWDGTEWVSV
jgi:hypothetical protein